MEKKKTYLVAVSTNSNGECVGIAYVKNVSDKELKELSQQLQKHLEEKQELVRKVKSLENALKDIKQEIKVLKGEE